MSIFNFFKKSTVADLDEGVLQQLKNLASDNFVIAIFDDISNRIKAEVREDIVHALPLPQQVIYTTQLLEFEVYNGGFNQYFWNDASFLIEDAIRGYQILGCVEYSTIVKAALERIESKLEKFSELRKQDTKDAFIKSYHEIDMSDLDQQFDNLEPLDEIKEKYIRDNLEAFVH